MSDDRGPRARLLLTSAQNPRVKEAAGLRERRARERAGRVLVEGAREIDRALRSGWAPLEVFAAEELLSREARALVGELERRLPHASVVGVSAAVFEKLALREGSDGLVVIFERRGVTLAQALGGERPLVLALHGVEKPGNIGALARSADGCGATGMVLLEGCSDPMAPQAIRASLGTVFSVPVATATSEALRAAAEMRGLSVIAAALGEAARPPWEHRLAEGAIVLLGAEATGLPDAWLASATGRVLIPMRGIADSLNVAAAGAMLLYEALKQRSASPDGGAHRGR